MMAVLEDLKNDMSNNKNTIGILMNKKKARFLVLILCRHPELLLKFCMVYDAYQHRKNPTQIEKGNNLEK